MTIRTYFFSSLILLILSTLTLGYVLFTINPFEATTFQIFIFYAVLFVFSLLLFSVLGYLARVLTSRNNPLQTYAHISLRQGSLLAILFIAVMFLQNLRSLSFLSITFLVISLTLLEIAFLTR